MPASVADLTALTARGFLRVVSARSTTDVTLAVTDRGREYADLMKPDAAKWVRQKSFDGWDKDGTWTPIPETAKAAAALKNGIPVRRIADQLEQSRSLGWIDYSTDSVVLKVIGMADLEGADPYLEAFLKLVSILVECQANAARSEVTDRDLRRAKLGAVMIRRVRELADREAILFSGGGATGDGWQYRPSDEISRFSNVRSIDDYISVASGPVRLPTDPPSLLSFLPAGTSVEVGPIHALANRAKQNFGTLIVGIFTVIAVVCAILALLWHRG